MTITMALVLLAAVCVSIPIWRRRALPRSAFLENAVPLALVPLLVAAAAGAWRLRAEFMRIAETGQGGIANPVRVSIEFAGGMLVAAAFAVVALAIALVIASRSPKGPVSHLTHGTPAMRIWRPVSVLLIVGAVVYTVVSADRAALYVSRILAPMSAEPPPFAVPVPDAPVVETAGVLGRNVLISISGGLALVLLIVAWAAAVPRLARHAPDTRAAVAGALTVAVGIMLAGGWYCVRLVGAVRWMERVVAQ